MGKTVGFVSYGADNGVRAVEHWRTVVLYGVVAMVGVQLLYFLAVEHLTVAVALLLEPVRTTVWYGQINVFLMLLLLWDLGRPAGSRFKGFSIGIAAGIKLTPLRDYWGGAEAEDGVVLGFGHLSDTELRESLSAVAAALQG